MRTHDALARHGVTNYDERGKGVLLSLETWEALVTEWA